MIQKAFSLTLRLVSYGVGGLCLGILVFLFSESLEFLNSEGVQSLFTSRWFPSENKFGFIPLILTSLGLAFFSLLISTPLAILFSGALIFSKGKKKLGGRVLLNTCAALPSVVLGFWGLNFVVPLVLKISPPGTSFFSATVVLTIMIIPTYTLLMISALEEKEAELKLVGRSLGLSSASLFLRVVLPSSKRLLFSSSLISFGRIFGETIIVAMVAGNVVQVPTSLLHPVRSLTSNMALEMAYALDTHQSALFFSGFLIALLMSLLSLWAMKNEGGK